ncbi:hypothetical protein AcW1_007246 [Taiwanofungus camphoratus]|nr:hypothetical protein AcW1_007246 [Antrodia cinnamomea]
MKRNSGLVSYESSDEDNVSSPHPRSKKRKLPVLSPSLVPPPPLDDPTLHQGRMRTTPHVEGQFAAFIYVPLVLDHHSLLYKLLLKVFALAKSIVPCLHPIVALDSSNPDMACKNNESTGGDDSAKNQVHGELHVSLTRPIYLRAHQREALRRAVNTVARSQSAFSSSFATFTELTNDERTRTFLALEVGAGHHQASSFSTSSTQSYFKSISSKRCLTRSHRPCDPSARTNFTQNHAFTLPLPGPCLTVSHQIIDKMLLIMTSHHRCRHLCFRLRTSNLSRRELHRPLKNMQENALTSIPRNFPLSRPSLPHLCRKSTRNSIVRSYHVR